MPRRAYIADLKKLSSDSDIAGISNVRSGEDDGEFCFAITDAEGSSYDISALIPDVSEYPSSHTYHIFADDKAPAYVGAALDRLPRTSGLSLSDLLGVVSRNFLKDEDGDTVMGDSQYADEDDGYGDDDEDGDHQDISDDDMFGGHATNNKPLTPQDITPAKISAAADLRERIRSDLRLAKAEGFKVGHQGPLLDGQSAYVSVSIRISKLGISEEAMQAWELSPSDYLVLIIHYIHGYRTVDDFQALDPSGARNVVGFRVGVSHKYKPTLQEAIAAFTKLSVDDEAKQRKEEVIESKTEHKTPRGFHDAFISRPMNELMNERLATILKYRYLGMPWKGAEEFYNDYQGKSTKITGSDYMEPQYAVEETRNPALPDIVMGDHILQSSGRDRHSLPLLAMQFLLRHFVRCTEFCLVCHCKLEDDLEALKPYVCDKPLCLYQYMSLGFGPSIEHEIISQPYVVDLLISFCYSSALGGGLKTFPNGLSLNVPDPLHVSRIVNPNDAYRYGINQAQPQANANGGAELKVGHEAKMNQDTKEIMFERGTVCPVRTGDWICFNIQARGSTEIWEHCQVTETALYPTIRVSAPLRKPDLTAQVDKPKEKKSPYDVVSPAGFVPVTFHVYQANFDTLNENQKRAAIITQLDLLPPVSEIKEYLLRNCTATLASWPERISPTAAGILRWIIASNRACIVQVDDPERPDKSQSERIQGVEGWMQFRFAMGAPDKERRFMSSVQETQKRLNLAHPTLFAWHGSPLRNWHSIVREGLHFKDVSHGRAYGNGCYHSLDYNTSFSYSGGYHNYNGGIGGSWPASSLKINNAMALNEIVNAPSEFVSRSPHLVVAQLDWIQTRYLFVQVSSAITFKDSSSIDEVFPQDSSVSPNGPKASKIKIPMMAMPKSRRGKLAKSSKSKNTSRHSGFADDPIPRDEDDSDATDTEDLNILIDDEEDYVAASAGASEQVFGYGMNGAISKGKGKGLFGDLLGKMKSSKSKGGKNTAMNGAMTTTSSKPLTDFVPGTLDYSKLPILAKPSFATPMATRRLQKEFQSLLKVQAATPLHELGWYTNPEKVENMYQWVIEMHSFEPQLPLAQQMKEKGITSVVMEMRFGPDFPMSPPFIRVIKPRFLNFLAGGGGHVTAGGSICMELLTNSGWNAVSTMESVLLQVRLAMSSTDPRPAQLDKRGGYPDQYGVGEAIEAYMRACNVHGWKVPANFRETAMGGDPNGGTGYY